MDFALLSNKKLNKDGISFFITIVLLMLFFYKKLIKNIIWFYKKYQN